MTTRHTYPRRGKRLALSLCLVAGSVLGIYCTTTTPTPGQDPAILGRCSFPRACYLVHKSGPLQGQCDSCATGASCRLIFTADETGATSGTWKLGSAAPGPLDSAAICGNYTSPSADLVALCLSPEMVCVARGPECSASSYCVAEGQDCASGVMSFPQHRPGTDKTACPTEKSRCCAPATDGGSSDGGSSDGSVSDGGVTDLSSTDAGLRG
ncbi:MAG TPA: hypothetical protein PK472_07830 [Pseudomonadota bacterium]|nr:hypothetical protein [Pseudomonadota bacterium]HNF96397.1 hypothetical protein [Pseudomonadota bacterium]HNI60046.1 hypothetical protein [Pseudomonadota bacterium]